MDEVDSEEVDGCNGRIKHVQKHGPCQKAAQLSHIGQGLEFAGRTELGGLGRRAQDRSAERCLDLNRDAHQHEAAYHVEKHMHEDHTDHNGSQHDQCFNASARQHAVGDLEEVDRHDKDHNVDRQGEDTDR